MQGPFFLIWQNYASPVAQFRETNERYQVLKSLSRKIIESPIPKTEYPDSFVLSWFAHVHNARHVLYTDLAVGLGGFACSYPSSYNCCRSPFCFFRYLMFVPSYLRTVACSNCALLLQPTNQTQPTVTSHTNRIHSPLSPPPSLPWRAKP